MRTFLFLLFSISVIKARSIVEPGCQVSIAYPNGDLKEPQPLVLTDSVEPILVLPNSNRLLTFMTNESIWLVCPGPKNVLENLETKQYVKAVCLSGTEFMVNSEVHEFSSFKCKNILKETVRKTKNSCLGGHEKFDIGFNFAKHFVSVLEVCRDNQTLRSYYTKAKMVKEIGSHQSNYPRPYGWRYGSYYPEYDMYHIYKKTTQLETIEELLGSEELARKYIQLGVNQEQYFHRGHYAAKADFIFGSQQNATFWLLNAAPQWATFNTGNWLAIETDVRNFASDNDLDLDVYTGVHGITTLEDINGEDQPVYLFLNKTHKEIPVPRFYWKIIHEPISNRATAFIGLNDPHAKEISDDMFLCPDISEYEDFSWLTWDARNITKGISYVCRVEELSKVVPTVPYLGEVSLLT